MAANEIIYEVYCQFCEYEIGKETTFEGVKKLFLQHLSTHSWNIEADDLDYFCQGPKRIWHLKNDRKTVFGEDQLVS